MYENIKYFFQVNSRVRIRKLKSARSLASRVDPVPRHSFNRQYVPVYDIPFKKIQTRREYVGEMFLLGTQLSLKNAPAAV